MIHLITTDGVCGTCGGNPCSKCGDCATFCKHTSHDLPVGNQARLNNGCVCDSGCDQCGRLAEAFTEMRYMSDHDREVLRRVTDAMVSADSKYVEAFESMREALTDIVREGTASWAKTGTAARIVNRDVIEQARAALALADKVTR